MRFKSIASAALVAAMSVSCSDATGPQIALSDAEIGELFATLLLASAGVDGIDPDAARSAPTLTGASAIRKFTGGAANATTSITVTSECYDGGSVSVSGSATDNTTSFSFDINESFNSCHMDPFTMSGNLHYYGTYNMPNEDTFSMSTTMKGSVDVNHADGRSGKCTIDFTMNMSDSPSGYSATINGKICGKNANSLGGSF